MAAEGVSAHGLYTQRGLKYAEHKPFGRHYLGVTHTTNEFRSSHHDSRCVQLMLQLPFHECVPPFGSGGGGTRSHAREWGGRSQFGLGDRRCGTLGIYVHGPDRVSIGLNFSFLSLLSNFEGNGGGGGLSYSEGGEGGL